MPCAPGEKVLRHTNVHVVFTVNLRTKWLRLLRSKSELSCSRCATKTVLLDLDNTKSAMKLLALAALAFFAGSSSAFAPSTSSQSRAHVFQLEMANGSKRKLALKVRSSLKLVSGS
jgi:hypothetical protein